jgi:SANT/Myb-like domain of DAMP1
MSGRADGGSAAASASAAPSSSSSSSSQSSSISSTQPTEGVTGVLSRARDVQAKKEKRQQKALSREMRLLAENRKGVDESIPLRFKREMEARANKQQEDAPPSLVPSRPVSSAASHAAKGRTKRQQQILQQQAKQRRVLPACRWVWRPYRNATRDDRVMFCRWERLDTPGTQPQTAAARRPARAHSRGGSAAALPIGLGDDVSQEGIDGKAMTDVAFPPIGRKLVLPEFTEAEYRTHIGQSRLQQDDIDPLSGPPWTRDLTDELWDLCVSFECRWPVIMDRFSGDPEEFTIDDLKARFYFVMRRVLQLRQGPGVSLDPSRTGDVFASLPQFLVQEPTGAAADAAQQRHDLAEFAFDLPSARRRREHAEIEYNKTAEEVAEETVLVAKLREIEAALSRHERMRAKAIAVTNIALSGYRGLTPLDAVAAEEHDEGSTEPGKKGAKKKAPKKKSAKKPTSRRKLSTAESSTVLSAAAQVANNYGLAGGAPSDQADADAVLAAAEDLANLPPHSRPAHFPIPTGVGPHLRSAQLRTTWPTLPGSTHVSSTGAPTGLAGAADRLLVDLGVCAVGPVDPHAPILVGTPLRVSPAVPTSEVLSVLSELRADVAALVKLHDHMRQQDYELRLMRSELGLRQPEENSSTVEVIENAARTRAAKNNSRKAAASGDTPVGSGSTGGGSATAITVPVVKKRRRSGQGSSKADASQSKKRKSKKETA